MCPVGLTWNPRSINLVKALVTAKASSVPPGRVGMRLPSGSQPRREDAGERVPRAVTEEAELKTVGKERAEEARVGTLVSPSPCAPQGSAGSRPHTRSRARGEFCGLLMTKPLARPNGPAPRRGSCTSLCEVPWGSSTAGAENKLGDLAGTGSSSGQGLGASQTCFSLRRESISPTAASAAWRLLGSLEPTPQPACNPSVSTLSSPQRPLHTPRI